MTFTEAYKLMKDGKKVCRPNFKGYWFIDSESGEVKVVTASGKLISYGKLDISIKNVIHDDWKEYEEPKKIEETESNKSASDKLVDAVLHDVK